MMHLSRCVRFVGIIGSQPIVFLSCVRQVW